MDEWTRIGTGSRPGPCPTKERKHTRCTASRATAPAPTSSAARASCQCSSACPSPTSWPALGTQTKGPNASRQPHSQPRSQTAAVQEERGVRPPGAQPSGQAAAAAWATAAAAAAGPGGREYVPAKAARRAACALLLVGKCDCRWHEVWEAECFGHGCCWFRLDRGKGSYLVCVIGVESFGAGRVQGRGRQEGGHVFGGLLAGQAHGGGCCGRCGAGGPEGASGGVADGPSTETASRARAGHSLGGSI